MWDKKTKPLGINLKMITSFIVITIDMKSKYLHLIINACLNVVLIIIIITIAHNEN